ncbi:MAG: hypothetical protein IKI48_03975 [Prevotella sp.]|jgi:predicted RNase H-like nuclease (RuvC/YqgF family)|uniref:hypothetical protein n=1 Tax=Prevotella sp. Rep29 TaxID=2691580 RepID=UPI001C6E303F|nr:hypothetical protein [Prevotella sp. Rep29]MBR3388917.1 hypothetical protein [Prevotella sp.]MBR7013257.1 hypothetical protein [Prevotella sp.]MBR7093935.1 hypothetical protein [Prevotella sp.]QYR10335.1 hypothetical protein GRF55_04070 [Prevotella sp. Rep29]
MADKNENTLTLFTTRVRQMILQYKEVKAENRSLQVKLDERDEEIKLLKGQIDQLRSDYDMLKMAKMVEITDGDMESAKARLAKLIRDVNKCITLLSEK